MNRNVFKRTYLIDAFKQHLTDFWLGFLGLFLDVAVKNCTWVISPNRDMLQPQKVAHIKIQKFKNC